MSMVECPECGKNISRIAINCPKCGFPAALYFGSNDTAEGSDEDEPYIRVAHNPATPESLLIILSRSDNWKERLAAAQNPKSSFAILEMLSTDDDEDVRAAVAGNGNVPISLLEKLADDDCSKVVEAVLSNPAIPEYIAAVAEESLCSVDSYDDYDYDDDDWDDPADYDPKELGEGYYHSRSGDFYVDAYGERCDVTDTTEYGGARMYYDENNSAWIEC